MTTTTEKKRSIRLPRKLRGLRQTNEEVTPEGLYRPRKRPKPIRDYSMRNFWISIALLILTFWLAQIWKANEIALVCTRLDSLRDRQQELLEKKQAVDLQFKDAASYARIEPLAREKLGMLPAQVAPVVIARFDERTTATRTRPDSLSH
ncbi:MAG: hypothetical protein ABH878_05340 [bacterium]